MPSTECRVVGVRRRNSFRCADGASTLGDLGRLYGICAGPDFAQEAAGTLSGDSDEELAAALTICPDHPRAGAFRATMAAAKKLVADEAAGIVFSDGVRTVGKDIQPGVYVSIGNLSDCYWERLDSSGEILDNNFIMGAPRAQVTVRSSDFAFNSTGCGQWKRQ